MLKRDQTFLGFSFDDGLRLGCLGRVSWKTIFNIYIVSMSPEASKWSVTLDGTGHWLENDY